MKTFLFSAIVTLLSISATAQFTNATLQASGLTCSMCSKAVYKALTGVPFVEKVDVNLKTQEYNLTFKNDAAVNFDALSKAVEDAGFSVSNLKVTANVAGVEVKKDEHLKIGNSYFHFLNAANQTLNGTTTFSLVDQHFVSAKAFKKWSTASKMECVQTGRMETTGARIYHAVI